ncbi:MAG: hypothetical protein KAI47_04920, partial [Deltaproteobacteria bacterium]|nr:hypothetical protein [Deltaproteobacteria bacterium]
LPLVPPPAKPRAPPKPKSPPKPPKSVDILAKAPLKAPAGQPVSVKIDIEDPGKRVKHLDIRWRRIGGPDYSTINITYKGNTATVEGIIPVAAVGKKEGRLVYYVEAKDAAGHVVARSATENDPQEIDLVASTGGGGTHWAWWTVGIVGGAAAIAGGIVAAVLLTRNTDTPNIPGTADISVVLE